MIGASYADFVVIGTEAIVMRSKMIIYRSCFGLRLIIKKEVGAEE